MMRLKLVPKNIRHGIFFRGQNYGLVYLLYWSFYPLFPFLFKV